MGRLGGALLLVAAASFTGAQEPGPRSPCGAAGLSGKFFMSRADGVSWTLMVEDTCSYTSLRFSGDPANDVLQPTKGVARLAQVDQREVLILQESNGEFDFVLTVVRQGPRVYLVPTNQHLRFCLEWGQGWEPRKGPIGRFLLRGDVAAAVPRDLPAICRQK